MLITSMGSYADDASVVRYSISSPSILDLGSGDELPDLDELLLCASRDPNPRRPRSREQVGSGELR